MNENNRIIKNQAGVIYTLDSRQLLTKMSFFEIPKKSADIGHEFGVFTKTKHVGHVSHSIFVSEFEFDHINLKFVKTQNFQNLLGLFHEILEIPYF